MSEAYTEKEHTEPIEASLPSRETPPLEKPIDDPTILAEREARIGGVRQELATLDGSTGEANDSLAATRERLGLEPTTTQGISPETRERKQQLTERLVSEQANYPGDWTLALYERLNDPVTAEKMRNVYEAHKESFSDKVPNAAPPYVDKDRNFRAYQERHANEFPERVERLFTHTVVGRASEFGKTGRNLGTRSAAGVTYDERFTQPGAVFSDAEKRDGTPPTIRQKNIIESHEKGHAVREFSGAMAREITNALDIDKAYDYASKNEHASKASYSLEADEIIERMSQLKNYFGFKDNEEFTPTHLAYAKEHYIRDTGLDNAMSEFFAAVPPTQEERFLNVMNRYPI